MDIARFGTFSVAEDFLDDFRERPVPWGFGTLSRVTFERSYSRNGERWWQTCRRVVEGMFTILRWHCLSLGLPWSDSNARCMANEAYERLWSLKWCPPGRGLWIMGTEFLYERGGTALNSCAFISTRRVGDRLSEPFAWMFSLSMLGVGVGFDTRGAGLVRLQSPRTGDDVHIIEDSREGWAEALVRLLDAFSGQATLPASWDFGRIRPAGRPLRGFGGVSSGPAPLREMLRDLQTLYEAHAGRTMDAALIVDTMNLIGRCVIAGGIRRSAQIAFGPPGDASFLRLKADADRVRSHRWVANISVFATAGMNYGEVARETIRNGEPGFLWLDNARACGRMQDAPDWADSGAQGSNPCGEQTLWDRELCTLVETFPASHESLDDYLRTVRLALLYGKTVTLVPTGMPRSDAIRDRNRRIGLSMSGIVQAIARLGRNSFRVWCDHAYRVARKCDSDYSDWLCVPRSVKITTVKPSGSVSLLAGASPGVHWDHSPYYLRRVRVRADHPLVEMCRSAGYPIESDVYSEGTSVISFPLHPPLLARGKASVSLWEKAELAAFMQRYWSDNQVSCTVDFDPGSESGDVPRVLAAYEDRLKSIAFLPRTGHGYPQPPYEAIDSSRYQQIVARLKPLQGRLSHEPSWGAMSCEGGVCDLGDAP